MSEYSPKISIIVPVYKAEAYLQHCMESLLTQTFQDFEILLIDDGSPDCSGAICDEYARRDKRVLVFHKENGGVSSARNLGLDNAKGEWVTFVDSDDCVTPDYLIDFGIASVEGHNENRNILIYQGIYYWKAGIKSTHFQYIEDDSLQSGDSIIEKNSLFMDGCPCGKLYNRHVLNDKHIRFNTSLSLHEDHIFVYTYLLYAERIITRESINYYYRVDYNPDSLTQRKIAPAGLVQAGKLLIHYSKYLFAKYNIKRHQQRYFITHYGINQLYRAIWILMFDDIKDDKTNSEILEIKNILRFSFIIKNYSLRYPFRFLGALFFSLIPPSLLITYLNINKNRKR